MNSGFFATADGVKVIEFNARFGDPECMNIMSLFERQLARGDGAHLRAAGCSRADVPLREQASVVLYLVSPDYALRAGGRRVRVHARRATRSKRERLPACSSPRPSRPARTLPHGRHLACGRARDHRADARAGARARRRAAPPRCPCSSGASDVGDGALPAGPRQAASGRRRAEPVRPLLRTSIWALVQGWRR